MDIKEITLDEAKNPIVVTIPEGRSYTVKAEESGYTKDQVFTRDDFPSEINGNYIGLVKTKEKLCYPMYAISPTIKPLYLSGIEGYRNSSAILNNVCSALINNDDFFAVRSIKESDLKKFNYKEENITTCIDAFQYWIASSSCLVKNNFESMISGHLTVGKVVWDEISQSKIYFKVGEHDICLPDYASIRPVVILNSVVVDA